MPYLPQNIHQNFLLHTHKINSILAKLLLHWDCCLSHQPSYSADVPCITSAAPISTAPLYPGAGAVTVFKQHQDIWPRSICPSVLQGFLTSEEMNKLSSKQHPNGKVYSFFILKWRCWLKNKVDNEAFCSSYLLPKWILVLLIFTAARCLWDFIFTWNLMSREHVPPDLQNQLNPNMQL